MLTPISRSERGRIVWNQEQSGTLGGPALGPILTQSGPFGPGLVTIRQATTGGIRLDIQSTFGDVVQAIESMLKAAA
jgi:hypothetical protein